MEAHGRESEPEDMDKVARRSVTSLVVEFLWDGVCLVWKSGRCAWSDGEEYLRDWLKLTEC